MRMKTKSGAIFRSVIFPIGRSNDEMDTDPSMTPAGMGGAAKHLLKRRSSVTLPDRSYIRRGCAMLQTVSDSRRLLNKSPIGVRDDFPNDNRGVGILRRGLSPFNFIRAALPKSPELVPKEMEKIHAPRALIMGGVRNLLNREKTSGPLIPKYAH